MSAGNRAGPPLAGGGIDRPRLIRVALGHEAADVVLAGGTVVSVTTRELVAADVVISGDRIAALARPGDYRTDDHTVVVDCAGRWIAPGLIDPHIHVESSNLTVTELARAIVPRGVSTLVADPHEIANVLGLPGIDLLVDEAANLPLDLLLRVPGRVPALPAHLETSGHDLDLAATLALLDRPDAACLGGDINPALLLGADPDQLAKIEATIARGLTVGGQRDGMVAPDVEQDIVSIAVLERHRRSGAIGRGFVAGLGIRGGAVASTVNHDSHNIFVVGDSHEAMAVATNALAGAGGGYCAVVGTDVRVLVPLPVAGLISERPLDELADGLDALERTLIDELGCSLPYRPVYALNFLCLPNIPDVGLTDQGIIATASMSLVSTVVGGC